MEKPTPFLRTNKNAPPTTNTDSRDHNNSNNKDTIQIFQVASEGLIIMTSSVVVASVHNKEALASVILHLNGQRIYLRRCSDRNSVEEVDFNNNKNNLDNNNNPSSSSTNNGEVTSEWAVVSVDSKIMTFLAMILWVVWDSAECKCLALVIWEAASKTWAEAE